MTRVCGMHHKTEEHQEGRRPKSSHKESESTTKGDVLAKNEYARGQDQNSLGMANDLKSASALTKAGERIVKGQDTAHVMAFSLPMMIVDVRLATKAREQETTSRMQMLVSHSTLRLSRSS